tara:strand:- start:375 stop:896 length:522 start_codon:yes stop_codon:yes gene_type:complete
MEKFMKSKHIAPIYGNKENTCYTKENIGDEKVWKSRNAAVCVALQVGDKILVVKRGKELSHSGKYCLPCGYLDWDENCSQAASRELYEEAGVHVSESAFDKVGAYEVVSDPKKDELQNITFHYHIKLNKLPSVKVDGKEATEYAWVTNDDLCLDFAFNHKKRIEKIIPQFSSF